MGGREQSFNDDASLCLFMRTTFWPPCHRQCTCCIHARHSYQHEEQCNLMPCSLKNLDSKISTATWSINAKRKHTLTMLSRWCEDWLAWHLLHTRGGWYPHHTTCHLVIILRQICSWCVRRHGRVVLLVNFFSQGKGSNATPTIMSSLVQDQAVAYIRATTEAHTDN